MTPARLKIGLGLLSLVLIACEGVPNPSLSQRPSDAQATPSPTESSPTSGRPYDSADVLAAMRDSRRPGGVPDQIETDAVAVATAEFLWTWDGTRWDVMSIGGACGPTSCSLDVAGSPGGGAGTDLYSFTVDPATGAVTLTVADLHGYPLSLEPELDAVTRAAIDADQLEGLVLAGMRWLPPPDEGHYWLAYRSGGEEGAPGLDALVDRDGGEVVEVRPTT